MEKWMGKHVKERILQPTIRTLSHPLFPSMPFLISWPSTYTNNGCGLFGYTSRRVLQI